jgi:hypothetical protein
MHRVKLFVGMITAEKELFDTACALLAKRVGEVDLISETSPFDYTDYYTRELGSPLFRRFASFRKLVSADALSGIKRFTGQIERWLSHGRKRRINLDPGYITEKNLVLVSTKFSGSRVYLRDRIYGETTLFYHKGRFYEVFWTYPDFRDKRQKEFFFEVRRVYLVQRKR